VPLVAGLLLVATRRLTFLGLGVPTPYLGLAALFFFAAATIYA
jgi:hypothetical protein